MDQESLAQMKQIVTEATEAVEGRLRGKIEDDKRQTDVLVEHLEHKISLLVEGQEAVRQYMGGVAQKYKVKLKKLGLSCACRISNSISGWRIWCNEFSPSSMAWVSQSNDPLPSPS